MPIYYCHFRYSVSNDITVALSAFPLLLRFLLLRKHWYLQQTSVSKVPAPFGNSLDSTDCFVIPWYHTLLLLLEASQSAKRVLLKNFLLCYMLYYLTSNLYTATTMIGQGTCKWNTVLFFKASHFLTFSLLKKNSPDFPMVPTSTYVYINFGRNFMYRYQ